jgi:hypothetical protein
VFYYGINYICSYINYSNTLTLTENTTYRIFSLIYLLILAQLGAAQKTSKHTNIIGSAYIVGNISPNEAKAQALNESKINALRAAGIAEDISTYQLLFTSQQKNDFTQFFNSSIQSEMLGAVQDYEIISERTYCKNENEIVCELKINATIIKYDTKPDNTFDANTEGIKAVYNNNENLTFTIRATQNCYLTIFNITDKEAIVMYPNKYEKQQALMGSQRYAFPQAKINYTLSTDAPKRETNRLIFVFTKTPITFIKMNPDQTTTLEHIFNWIYAITPDQRKVEYVTLTITK